MRRSFFAILVAILTSALPAHAASPPVLLVASLDGGQASDGPVMAKAGQTVTLYAVVQTGQGKTRRFVTAAPALRLRGRHIPAREVQAPGPGLRFAWALVEPYPHHVHLSPPNPGNPAYSNALLFGPDHGRWLGYDTIEYHETALSEQTGPSLVVKQARPTDAHVNVHDGLGTMRYKVAVSGTLADGHTVVDAASPGADAREGHGIARSVLRVSFRRGDDVPGRMTAFYNVPNVFGSGGSGDSHQTDLFQGADCADVIIGALRAAGVKLAYSSVKGLFAHARPVTDKLMLDGTGLHALVDGRPGDAVHLRFGDDVRLGDIMLIDYVNAQDLPRAWDHVAVVSGDAGTPGEFDPDDRVMHMGYLYGLTEAPARSEGPAVVQFLRWKPSVTAALARAGRAQRP